MKRKRSTKVDDPLRRGCPACGAAVGEGCRTVELDGKQLSRVPRATRLVHADRIEQQQTGANERR